jgi:hypothetical protein
MIFPLASDGVFGVYIVMPDLVTRTVPIPLSWRLETAVFAAEALPLFPPPELAGLPPGEPHAATVTAAAARPETAVPCLRARRGARPAGDESVPGAAGRCVPAMSWSSLFRSRLLVPVDTPAASAVFTRTAETCRRDDRAHLGPVARRAGGPARSRHVALTGPRRPLRPVVS